MSVCFLSLETSKIFNQLILKNLEEEGFDGLSEALIVIFPFISEYENITIANLAKKLGYSRQAMHKNIKKLEEFEYINLKLFNQKEKSIHFTKKGEKLMQKANDYILKIEKELCSKLGKNSLEEYKKTQTILFEFLKTL